MLIRSNKRLLSISILIVDFSNFIRIESPLARGNREKSGNFREDSPGRCSDGSSKGSHSCPIYSREGVMRAENDEDSGIPGESGASRQDEAARRRELALRQHAFFQLRLHIRRGANLVAMDRCGKSSRLIRFHTKALLTLLSLCHPRRCISEHPLYFFFIQRAPISPGPPGN